VSQWAEARLYLSSEDSAEKGRYSAEQAPYQRGIMDAFNEEGVEEVVAMTSAQIGKSLILKAIIGPHIDIEPAPILVIQPNVGMANTFSKEQLAPMIRNHSWFHHREIGGR